MKKVRKSKNTNRKKEKYEDDDNFFNDIAHATIMAYRRILREKMKEEKINKNKIKKILEL